MTAISTAPSITTSTNLGPLTPTAFPTACLSSLWNLNTPGLGVSTSFVTQGCAVSTCCPSGNFYTDGFAWLSTYYSPGWCPSQYRECAPPKGSTSLKTSNGESVAFCCPTNYACPSTASLNVYQFCQSLYSGTTEVVVLNNIFDQSTISTRIVALPSREAVVYPIQIRRQPGQPAPTVESVSSSSIMSTSSDSAQSRPQTQATSGKGLSGGAIAGVVIGTVVGLGITGLLVWIALILRRRAKPFRDPQSAGDMPDIASVQGTAWKNELPVDHDPILERNQGENAASFQSKPSPPALPELQGSEGGTELPSPRQ